MNQITLFDLSNDSIEPENTPVIENEKQEIVSQTTCGLEKPDSITETSFELDQKVQVIVSDINSSDPEDYYYLIDFKNKRGFISNIYNGKVKSYSVIFNDGKEGIFYKKDLIAT
ncbi:hypothetical protein ACFFIX_19670 [Metabacillus herbersteinensis]|uniref:SH3 domain-containing protein n=1 Tax=Metabacillus herbersteinensis TaxID=283816 RepID=A0ABV6GJ64_9BACI